MKAFNKTKDVGEKKKDFSSTTKMLIVAGVLVVLVLTIFSLRVFGDVTVGITLTTNPDLERGLVGHWTFDGGDIDWGIESSIRDRSGQGNHGTTTMATSTSPVAGKIGQALEFATSSVDFVQLGDPSNLNITGNITVAAWIKFSVSQSNKPIVARWGIDQSYVLLVDVTNANRLEFAIRVSEVNKIATSSNTYNDDQWHHVVGVFNGSNVLLYIDGDGEIVTGESTSGPIDNPANVVFIGGYNAVTDLFSGAIDDVRIYNRALSSEEIKRLYQLGATTKINTTIRTNPDLESGLVGHWTFDGKDINIATNVITDRSGNGNNGTTFGMDAATTTVAGKIGQALDFDDNNDFVEIEGDDASLRFGTEPFTLVVWAKPANVNQSDVLLIKRESISPFRQVAMGVGSYEAAGGGFSGVSTKKLRFVIRAADGDDQWVYNTTNDIIDGNWHHVVFVRPSSGTALVYVDGVLQSLTSVRDEGTGAQSDANVTGGNWSIGGTPQAVGVFNGPIDDVRIYNRALSSEEIKRLYELGATTKVATTITTNPDLESGLVGHWTFDGPDVNIATNVITDRSGNGNDGSTIGMDTATTTVAGKIGQAMEFDGVDDYVDVGLNILPRTNVTMAGWIKRNSLGTLDSMFGDNNANPSEWGYCLRIKSDDIPNFEAVQTSPTEGKITDNTDTMLVGIWYHMVGVRDGGSLLFYQDGVLKGTDSLNTEPVRGGTTQSQTIGTCFGSNLFDGTLDDVRIYNRALSADEIKRLYDLGR